MGKTIALLTTLDTKKEEAVYLKDRIEENGNNVLLVDMATLGPLSSIADINRTDIYAEINRTEDSVAGKPKNEIISTLSHGLQALMLRLYKEKKYNAIVAIGGLQNAMLGAAVMTRLPIGLPKMIISSVLSGVRQVGLFVGTKDIILVPTVVDFFGLNPIITSILDNASVMISSAAEHEGTLVKKQTNCIGMTCMGVTEGLSQIAGILKTKGIQTAAFHATGVGGQAMEELAKEGKLTAILDLTMHELVSNEYFRKGPSYGEYTRIEQIADLGIPAIFAPGGLDFIDLYKDDFLSNKKMKPEDRKYNLHNQKIAHIKLNEKEAKDVAKLFAAKVNRWTGDKAVILPLRGMRTDTEKSQPLFDPDIDEVLLNNIKCDLDDCINIVEVDANINDNTFASKVCEELYKIIEIR